MTDLKISQFADGGSIQDTDQVATNRGGVNTRVTVGTAAAADIGTGAGQIPTADDLGTMAFENSGDYVPVTQLGNNPGQIAVFDGDSNGDPVYPAADGSQIYNIAGLPSLPIVPADGGTGLSSYAVGDIIYASASTTFSKLAGVATGNVLLSGGVATAPAYGKVGLTTHISGTLAEGNGGTNQTTYATGDILYATGANTLGKLAAGTNTHVLTLAGGVPTWAAAAGITTSATQTWTSGTSLTFTGISSTSKFVILPFSGISTNGSSPLRFRIGPSGGVATTGYNGTATSTSGGGIGSATISAGIDLNEGGSATFIRHGCLMLTLIESATNTWAFYCTVGNSDAARSSFTTGTIALSGALERVSITTVGGTDTGDAGTASVSSQG